MKNGDYIRSLDNDRLARFLCTFGINHLTSFMQYGASRLMNAKELREWMDSDEFICEETEVSEDFIYDQDFNLKEKFKLVKGESNEKTRTDV